MFDYFQRISAQPPAGQPDVVIYCTETTAETVTYSGFSSNLSKQSLYQHFSDRYIRNRAITFIISKTSQTNKKEWKYCAETVTKLTWSSWNIGRAEFVMSRHCFYFIFIVFLLTFQHNGHIIRMVLNCNRGIAKRVATQ